MCQHVIVDFCLTFHSGQELLISSLIICRYHQCRHNLCVIMIIIAIAILIIVVKIEIVTTCVCSTLDCGQTAAMEMHTCSIRKRLFAEMQNHNCLRGTLRLACVFLELRKKFWTAGERSSFFFFYKNQLPQNLHNDEWVVWSTRKLILWSFISSLGNLPKIALRNISHPGTGRNMVGGVE